MFISYISLVIGELVPKRVALRAPPGHAEAPRWALLTSRLALARFVGVMLLLIAAQAMMETTFGLWSKATLRWGPREVGWTLAGLGFGAALLQGGVAGRAARTLGERVTLLIGLALVASGFGGLGVAQTPGSMAAALAALVVWKHRANLARLRAGTELRIGERTVSGPHP